MKPLFGSLVLCAVLATGCNRASSPETVSAQLGAVLTAPAGKQGLTVDNALVTYVVDDQSDQATLQNGFFLQAERGGPALFVPKLSSDSMKYRKWVMW